MTEIEIIRMVFGIGFGLRPESPRKEKAAPGKEACRFPSGGLAIKIHFVYPAASARSVRRRGFSPQTEWRGRTGRLAYAPPAFRPAP